LLIEKTVKSAKDTIVIAAGVRGEEIRYYLRDYNIVKTDSLDEAKRINSIYSNVVFFITYDWTIPRGIMQFVREKYMFSVPFRSRIAVTVYTKIPHITNNVY